MREFACLTTVILASGAENLGSELPVVHHFARIRRIRWIGFQFPSGSQTVKNTMILSRFLGKWGPESDQLLGGPPGHPKAPLGTPEPLQGPFLSPKNGPRFDLGFCHEGLGLGFVMKILLLPPSIYQDFKGYAPTCFLAITCTSWLRLNFWRRGFARNFCVHLFVFYAPGWMFGPLVQFWDHRVNILARGPFWAQIGVLQNILL